MLLFYHIFYLLSTVVTIKGKKRRTVLSGIEPLTLEAIQVLFQPNYTAIITLCAMMAAKILKTIPFFAIR